ncbi:MAG TPA: phosphoribosyltransferase family protein [Acidimicrobiales bacterium]|nr:phosphoribosyltransferase family protein [Acidimicrobiales bacterium]
MAFSVGVHQGALRGAITRYKYRGERSLAGVFAATMSSYISAHACWFEEFDLITAVPSYLGAGARRSWDPVGTILAQLPGRLGHGWEVLPGVIIKRRETPGMAGLGWAQRQAVACGPLRQALAVPDPGLVAGSQVLVLDDVLTEGSTLREVALALRRAGATDVAGLVLARPPWTAARPGT